MKLKAGLVVYVVGLALILPGCDNTAVRGSVGAGYYSGPGWYDPWYDPWHGGNTIIVQPPPVKPPPVKPPPRPQPPIHRPPVRPAPMPTVPVRPRPAMRR
jgi:predicted small secreted protein